MISNQWQSDASIGWLPQWMDALRHMGKPVGLVVRLPCGGPLTFAVLPVMREWSACVQVPSSTMLIWLTPPPVDEVKYYKWRSGGPHVWPSEWIRVLAPVAAEVGLLRPAGPAYLLDLYSIALGEAGNDTY